MSMAALMTDELSIQARRFTSRDAWEKRVGPFRDLETNVPMRIDPNGGREVLIEQDIRISTHDIFCEPRAFRIDSSYRLYDPATGDVFGILAVNDPQDGTGKHHVEMTCERTVENKEVETISGGVLTRFPIAGVHLIRSEVAGAADDLDSITGTDLFDNEVMEVRIYATDEPITLKHVGGTLELIGAADRTLTALTDWSILQYDEAGTKWVEIDKNA